MKFLRAKPFSGDSLDAVVKFLRVDIGKILSDLVEGLRHLTFRDNFDSFEWQVEIAAGETATFPNRLHTPSVRWWPVRITGGTGLVETEITKDTITLENTGADDLTAVIQVVR